MQQQPHGLQLQPRLTDEESARARANWLLAVRLAIEQQLYPNAQDLQHSDFYALRLRALRRSTIRLLSGSPITSAPAPMDSPSSPTLFAGAPMVEDDDYAPSPAEPQPSPSAVWHAFVSCPGCGPWGGSQLVCQETAGRSCYEARHRREHDSMELLLDELE